MNGAWSSGLGGIFRTAVILCLAIVLALLLALFIIYVEETSSSSNYAAQDNAGTWQPVSFDIHVFNLGHGVDSSTSTPVVNPKLAGCTTSSIPLTLMSNPMKMYLDTVKAT